MAPEVIAALVAVRDAAIAANNSLRGMGMLMDTIGYEDDAKAMLAKANTLDKALANVKTQELIHGS